MANNIVARKTYTFRGVSTNGTTWECKFLIYKGTFGRFEAWNPDIHFNITPEQGSFAVSPYVPNTQGNPFSYNLSDVTINGASVYSNGTYSSGVTATGSSKGITLELSEAIDTDSIVEVTIKSARTYIPWIPYRDRQEFYYNPNRGMIDWDGLSCDSIGLSQNINMDYSEMDLFLGFVPINLVGLLINLGAGALFFDGALMGRGVISVIKNSNTEGSAIYNNEGKLLFSAPQEVIKYKYETGWYRQYLNPASVVGTVGNPSIINQTQCLTGEYFLLKYHNLFINPFVTSYDDPKYQFINLKSYGIFPYLIYGDFNIKTDTLGKPYRFPRWKGETPLNNIDLSYRTSFFNLENDSPQIPFMVDRLRALNNLSPSSIKANTEPAPDEYAAGIWDEFNYLNSRIKINKLIQLTTVKLSEEETEDSFSVYKINNLESASEEEIQLLNEVRETLDTLSNISFGNIRELFNNMEIKVILESNCSKNFSQIKEDKTYTISGKLFDSRWMMANKGILKRSGGGVNSDADPNIEFKFSGGGSKVRNESLLAEKELWKYVGLSQPTLDYILDNAIENIDKICLYLVVRGIDEKNGAEIILKDPNKDYIIEEKPNNEPDTIKPAGVSSAQWLLDKENEEALPVTTIKGETIIEENSDVQFNSFNYIKILFQSEENDDEFYEISRKFITPNKLDFNLNVYEDLLCPLRLIEDGNNNSFVFNPPECGALNTITVSVNGVNKQVAVPYYVFEVNENNEADYFKNKPSNQSYEFQIVYGQNRILPYTPSLEDPSIPNPNDFGWVALSEGNNFKGIKLSRPWDQRTQFFLRCIKKVQAFQNRTSPVKKTKSVQFKITAGPDSGYPKINFYLNRSNDEFTYNTECVGLNRLSTYSDWYTEIIPGRGLKTVTGHGVVFDAFDQVGPYDQAITGAMNFPWVYFDPYQENNRILPIEQVEKNDFIQLERGAELEFNTNLKDRDILNVYTLTTYSSIVDSQIKIFSLYNETFEESFILYNSENGRINIKCIKSDFQDGDDFIKIAENQERNFEVDFYNAKTEKTISLGKGDISTGIIVTSVENNNNKILKARLSTKEIIEENIDFSGWTITTAKTLSENAFVESIYLEAELPSANQETNILQNSVFVKVSHSTNLEPTTMIDYGYNYGFPRKNIYGEETFNKPQIFPISNGLNRIKCPCLFSPNTITVSLVIPNNLTPSQYQTYVSTLKSCKFKIISLGILDDSKVPRALTMSASLGADNLINVFYNSEFIYRPNGEQYTPTNFEDSSITQLVQSNDSGSRWSFPAMEDGVNVKISELNKEGYENELIKLKEAGYVDAQSEILVQDERKWDLAMILSPMRSPSCIIDPIEDSTYLFGLFKGAGGYDLTSWKINNCMINSNFLPDEIYSKDAFNGILPRSDSDLLNPEKSANKLIAAGIPNQTIGVINTQTGVIIIVYKDTEGNVILKASDSGMNSWKTLPISLFGENSTFAECESISMITDKVNNIIFFFGLKKFGSTFHLYSISIPESDIESVCKPDILPENIERIQKEIDEKAKVLVVGNPNDLEISDYDLPNSKTRIGNSKKNSSGAFVILKPYLRYDEDKFVWDEENPTSESYSLDENISVLHSVHGYIDKNGLFRIFYLNKFNKIGCKVSKDLGQSWQVDLLV